MSGARPQVASRVCRKFMRAEPEERAFRRAQEEGVQERTAPWTPLFMRPTGWARFASRLADGDHIVKLGDSVSPRLEPEART